MISVLVTPGKTFGSTETVDNDKLNQLGQPTFAITGTIATTDVSAGAITASKTTVDANNYATSSFSAGSYTLTFSPATAPTALADGLEVCFKAGSDCTGATTINVGVGGAKTLLKNKTEALVVGDIVANQMVLCRYDSGAAVWQMQSHVSLPDMWRVTTGGAAPNFTATLTPPGGANSVTLANLQGRPIIVKMGADGAGTDTLQLTVGTATALASKQIRKGFNQPTAVGDLKQNQEIVVIYDSTTDTFQMQSQTAVAPFTGGPVASASNLIVQTDITTPNSKVNVVADEVLLKPISAAGAYFLAKSVNLTLDMGGTVSSPLGLDTGAEFPSVWYYVWAIYNGTTTSAVFSLSSTAPTLAGALASYTHIALVGVVRNDAGSNFIKFAQRDRAVAIDSQVVFTAHAASAAYAILVAADLTAFQAAVPPIAKFCRGNLGTTAGNAELSICATNSDGSLSAAAIGESTVDCAATAGGINGFVATAPFEVPVRGTNAANYNVQWKTANANARMVITGFDI